MEKPIGDCSQNTRDDNRDVLTELDSLIENKRRQMAELNCQNQHGDNDNQKGKVDVVLRGP